MIWSGSAITFYKAQPTVSDESTKYNVTPLDDEDAFDKVMQIAPISFIRIGDPDAEVELGFSANELNTIEERVTRLMQTDTSSLLTVSTDGILAMLVSAVKHLAARVAALEAA